MSNDVVIVIPAYKNELSPDESISVRQIFNVLPGYDICFIAPEGLDVTYKEIKGQKYRVEYFEQEYFASVNGYSSLCTSSFFYQRFIDYEFMLIYQMDAFVFSDRLMDFCRAGFDYWGAPVPDVYWKYMPVMVGNGGFSLRRVSKFLLIAEHRDEIVDIINKDLPEYWKNDFIKNEDELLIYGSELFSETKLNLPSVQQAFSFSIEFNIDSIYDDLESHLPFGCHRWARYKFEKWWPIISNNGYRLEEEYIEKLNNEKRDDSYNRLILENLLSGVSDAQSIADKVLGDATVSIWGLGKNSEKIIDEIKKYGLQIGNRYDRNAERYENAIEPNKESLSYEVHPIVLTSTKYEDEIRHEIIKMNIKNLMVYNLRSLHQRYLEGLEIDRIGERHNFWNRSLL